MKNALKSNEFLLIHKILTKNLSKLNSKYSNIDSITYISIKTF